MHLNRNSGKILVKFEHADSGLMTGHKHLLDEVTEVDEPLKGFEIKSLQGKWQAAEAEIVSNNAVVVSHPDIDEPAAVRYAWASNPKGANLYNKKGLPASIFTTEQ